MQTIDNLLIMDHCASCERELAPTWKFCIYCGRPLVLAGEVKPELDGEPEVELDTAIERELGFETESKPDVVFEFDPDMESDSEVIPAAIRVDSHDPDEPTRRKYDGPFWVGVGMAILGLVLIVYAAVQIYSSQS